MCIARILSANPAIPYRATLGSPPNEHARRPIGQPKHLSQGNMRSYGFSSVGKSGPNGPLTTIGGPVTKPVFTGFPCPAFVRRAARLLSNASITTARIVVPVSWASSFSEECNSSGSSTVVRIPIFRLSRNRLLHVRHLPITQKQDHADSRPTGKAAPALPCRRRSARSSVDALDLPAPRPPHRLKIASRLQRSPIPASGLTAQLVSPAPRAALREGPL